MTHKRTLTEEIDRFKQISEYDYDIDDVGRNSQYKWPRISTHSILDISKKSKNKSVDVEKEPKIKKPKSETESYPLDINNNTDKMKIFAFLSRGHDIKNATPETLKSIHRLRAGKSSHGNFVDATLNLNDDLSVEYGYYLLRFSKYGVMGTFPRLHLSDTFTRILNKEENGFKRNVAPPFEDFKNFLINNRKKIEDECNIEFEKRMNAYRKGRK